MLIIQNNLFNWSEGSDRLFNKKFGEMILMEYLWAYSERERLNEFFLDPNINLDDPNPEIEALINLNKLPLKMIKKEVNIVAKANFGFGDVNSCIILSKYN